ncbi:hypothetical protein DV738_g2083, partial [Chaetothyriales sp. CBS 135597]
MFARKWSQSEGAPAHLLDGGDLVKRRASKQAGDDASQDRQNNSVDPTLATGRKADDLGLLVQSKSRGKAARRGTKSGDQDPKPSGNNGRNLRNAEDKLSRKQKKLWNAQQSEANDHTGAEGKPTESAESDNALQEMQHQPTSTEFCTGPGRKGKGVLHDPKPNPFGNASDARLGRLGASPQQDPVSGAKAGPTSSLPPTTATTATTATTTTKLTPLQSKFAAKLTSARFRHLNEQLYTTRSTESLQLFKSQPSLFTDYHLGFTQQTQAWPVNPVNIFITALQTRHDLPRRKTGSCTIADLGCGDAPLARALAKGNSAKKLGLRIHSFDLHAVNEHVMVADIAELPLRDGEADIAIFCLSLMGTNWLDFVEECWRILRGDGKGEVWVAEVKSRFVSRPGRRAPGEAVDNSVGKKRRSTQKPKKKTTTPGQEDDDDHNVADDQAGLNGDDDVDGSAILDSTNGTNGTSVFSAFVSVFQRRGFKLKEGSVDNSNKMFVTMVFYKSGVPMVGKHKGLKWNGKEYQDQNDKEQRGVKTGPKFIPRPHNDDDGVDPQEEAAVLKPCVYKTR